MEQNHPLRASEHMRGRRKSLGVQNALHKYQHGDPGEASKAWLPTVPQFPVSPHWGQNHTGDQEDKPLGTIKDLKHGGNKKNCLYFHSAFEIIG